MGLRQFWRDTFYPPEFPPIRDDKPRYSKDVVKKWLEMTPFGKPVTLHITEKQIAWDPTHENLPIYGPAFVTYYEPRRGVYSVVVEYEPKTGEVKSRQEAVKIAHEMMRRRKQERQAHRHKHA